ncbi:MAG: histidine phosphatase family protein [Pseudomonadota bacterium]
MKTLHVMRHAKSSWKFPELSDIERPLNSRGRRDAPRMGEVLSRQLDPMGITVSSARRAQETLAGLSESWADLAEMQHTTDSDLYTFASGEVLQWLASLSSEADSIFIIGHNPALTDLANLLVADLQLPNLPTAGYLGILLDIDYWRDIQPGCGRMTLSLFPRDL